MADKPARARAIPDSPTTVVSVRGKDRPRLLADPGFVYVGRRCAGWPASPFGNPFRVGEWDNPVHLFDACLHWAMYGGPMPPELGRLKWPAFGVAYWNRMADLLPVLYGKQLGCWCCEWDGKAATMPPGMPCHALVLAEQSSIVVDALGVKAGVPMSGQDRDSIDD